LGDDVALDLGRAARDRAREAREERVEPAALLLAAFAVDDDAVGALQLHAELVELLARLRRRELHVRVLGRRRALGERREPLVPECAQARRELVRGGDPAPYTRVVIEPAPAREVDQRLDLRLEPRPALHPQAGALVRE